MLAATSRTTRLGVSFWNFMVSPLLVVVGERGLLQREAGRTPRLCARNASIHVPCEGSAGRAASLSVALAEVAGARGPRGTRKRIARQSRSVLGTQLDTRGIFVVMMILPVLGRLIKR